MQWCWWLLAVVVFAAGLLAWCRRAKKEQARVKVHIIHKQASNVLRVIVPELGLISPKVAVSHVTLQRAPSDPPGSNDPNSNPLPTQPTQPYRQTDIANFHGQFTIFSNPSGRRSDEPVSQSQRLNPLIPIHSSALPKLPLPEQLIKRTYLTTLPRPIIQLPAETEITEEVRPKKFSVTRSPSLEKDEKSPFIAGGSKFGFDIPARVWKDLDVEKGLEAKEMSDKEMSPKDFTVTSTKEMSPGNLRRFQSVSTKLNMCSVNETQPLEGQQERSEMQNSPRIIECSSAKEKSNVSKFDFSPRLLSESSPKFFTPPEMISPMFFVDPSPKSVYYDSVRSPKFFPETPRVDEQPQSPRALSDHLNRNRSKPNSPRILTPKPKSPKVYSSNKENYFTFDNVHLCEDGSTRTSPRPRRYSGRNSIERERFTSPADKETKKYRRHNSCEANQKHIETKLPKTEKTLESPVEDSDVVDCCVQKDSLSFESETKMDQIDLLSAQMRRQRLKSISLDSENARLIEQNLGLPIAKQIKDQMNEAYKQDLSTSCESIERVKERPDSNTEQIDCDNNLVAQDTSPTNLQKKSLRPATDAKSFVDMPRFSPKEFEIIVTNEEGSCSSAEIQTKKNKNLRNLTIDLTKRDAELEKELLEFEKLYTDAEEKKVKTPTLKVKAISLDSSETANLSLPQKKTLEVPQNSVSVPNTPKKQLKRLLAQRGSKDGSKFGYGTDQRRLYIKGQDSGIFLRENHAALMLYQPGTSRGLSRTMGSFDENIADYSENTPEINISQVPHEPSQTLGLTLLSYKPNLSVSSTNLKTLPEGVTSDDFEPSVEDEKLCKKLHRRNSNQMLSLDGKHSTHSSQSSNCSLNSSAASTHNLVRTSISNFSLSTETRQNKLSLERRDSNATMEVTTELAPVSKVIRSSSTCLSGDSKNCLLQRRGSNNSLTLNIHPALSRHSSNSSLNKDNKTQKKGLLERRSSNTSLSLNINNSNPQLSVNRSLSISNYNLNGSSMNLTNFTSNQSIDAPTEPKKGILERRSSNTSLTLNIQPQEPRVIEIDEAVLDSNLKEIPHKHRKSLSTENLLPKSYKIPKPCNENKSFGSHDNLWSNTNVYNEAAYTQNLTYVCGDHENEIIYAFGRHEDEPTQGFVRNITTKPLSPQTTSEDFRLYLANMQHLQNASSVLSRQKLRDLNDVFQNGYSNFKCAEKSDGGHSCLNTNLSKDSQPCAEYQKSLLRSLHQEFWDMPTNFQEKPIVSGSNPKNRYKSILPNEHSRFLLMPGEGTCGEGYINANFIKGHEYTRNSYIATQGPLHNTVYDFWLMIHQNHTNHFKHQPATKGVQKVVMLTNFVENNRQKCDKYFPLEVNDELTFESPVDSDSMTFFSDYPQTQPPNVFVIKNCGIVNKTGYSIRKLNVKFVRNYRKVISDERTVTQASCAKRTVNQASCDSNSDSSVSTSNFIDDSTLFVSNVKTDSLNQFADNTDSIVSECVVYHYWFHNWADHKCPKDVTSLLNLSLDILKDSVYEFSDYSQEELDKCSCSVSPKVESKFVFPPLESSQNSCDGDNPPLNIAMPLVLSLESDSPPAVVHCSAGIGRTGCFIAILNGIKQLLSEHKVDVLGIVCNMRLNRGGMVQNSEQYELIHKVLCLFENVCLPNIS